MAPPRKQAESLAENRGGTASEKKPRGRPFPKGNNANPGGRPKGLAAAVREVVDQDVLAKFWGAVISGYVAVTDPAKPGEGPTYEKVSVSDRIAVSKVIAERGWGKPAEFVPIEDEDPLDLGVREDQTIADALRQRADEIGERRRLRAEREQARRDAEGE